MRYLSFLVMMFTFVTAKDVNSYNDLPDGGRESQEIYINELFS